MRLCIPFIIASSGSESVAVENHFIAFISDPRSAALLIFNPSRIGLSREPPKDCRVLEPSYRSLNEIVDRLRSCLDELKHTTVREGVRSFRRIRLGLIAPLIRRMIRIPTSDHYYAIAVIERALNTLSQCACYCVEWLVTELSLAGDRIQVSNEELGPRFSWLYANDEGFRSELLRVVKL